MNNIHKSPSIYRIYTEMSFGLLWTVFLLGSDHSEKYTLMCTFLDISPHINDIDTILIDSCLLTCRIMLIPNLHFAQWYFIAYFVIMKKRFLRIMNKEKYTIGYMFN